MQQALEARLLVGADGRLRLVAQHVQQVDGPAGLLEVGGSPRTSLALDKCSRVHAWLNERDYVDPEDVRAIVHDVMRHRLMLSYEAQGEGINADRVVDAVVEQVALP